MQNCKTYRIFVLKRNISLINLALVIFNTSYSLKIIINQKKKYCF